MKAAVYHAPGEPKVLSYEDVADLVPGPEEAVVNVKACGVNRIDIWARNGRYKTALPHILGSDIAGEVVATGPETRSVTAGQSVVVYPVLSDGKCSYCVQGMPSKCVSRGFVGIATDGGYAEFVKVPAANLVSGEGLDSRAAAAMPVNFATAWNGLSSRARVGPKDTVMVWGAAGGLGYAAIQVSKLFGARVIALVGDDKKAKFVESQGADFVVNHRTEDISQRVRSLTDGLGASVVFDQVGGDTWAKSIESLARGGRMLTLGLTSGPKSEVDVRRVYQDELSILGTYAYSKEDLQQVLNLLAAGKLRPSIFQEFPLSSAARAHEIIESRDVQGKILLIP